MPRGSGRSLGSVKFNSKSGKVTFHRSKQPQRARPEMKVLLSNLKEGVDRKLTQMGVFQVPIGKRRTKKGALRMTRPRGPRKTVTKVSTIIPAPPPTPYARAMQRTKPLPPPPLLRSPPTKRGKSERAVLY